MNTRTNPLVQETAQKFLGRSIVFSMSSRENDRSLQRIVNYLTNSLSCGRDDVHLLVLDRTGTALKYVWPAPYAQLQARILFRPNRGLLPQSLFERRALIDNRIQPSNPLDFFSAAQSRRPSNHSQAKRLVYPILLENSPIGVVEIVRPRTFWNPWPQDFRKQDSLYIHAVESPLQKFFQSLRTKRVRNVSS